jgi:hypothetical protein
MIFLFKLEEKFFLKVPVPDKANRCIFAKILKDMVVVLLSNLCVYALTLFFFLFQLKAVELNSDLQILHEAAVQFDTDLPEFR